MFASARAPISASLFALAEVCLDCPHTEQLCRSEALRQMRDAYRESQHGLQRWLPSPPLFDRVRLGAGKIDHQG